MKSALLVLALLAVTSVRVHASENEVGDGGDSNHSNPSSNAQALAVAAVTGNSTSTVNVDNHRPAASSANSPSVGTGNDCQIATPSSKAFSVLVFSASGTTGVTYNDLCYAFKRGQFDVADKLMCLKSPDYAKANSQCKQ